jgi:hypothetical protein
MESRTEKKVKSNNDYIKIENPRDALAVLSLKFYQEFGEPALPLIVDVCHKLGMALGRKMRKGLSDNDLATVGQAFVDTAVSRGSQVEAIIKSADVFRFRTEPGFTCALGLNGSGIRICEAIMAMDHGLFEAATGSSLDMKIIHSVAVNDSCCEVEYRNKI